MNIWTVLAVACGGAIGAVLRYTLHRGLTLIHGAESAWSTLLINGAGSFGLGLAASYFLGRYGALPHFVMIGLLGAFTTFSTFALDALVLFRDRGWGTAALYVGLSVFLSLGAAGLGLMAGRGLT